MCETGSQSNRKLLLASYWYPPAVGAGAERAAAFIRYLPRHGWDCFLLTADRGGSALTRGAAIAVRDPAGARGVSLEDYDPRRQRGWLQLCAREVVFPDRFVFWGRAAGRPAVETVRREGIRLIVASFPPASVVSLALHVQRQTGAYLVLDLRDRWFGAGGYEPLCPVSRWRHARLERKAMSHSSAIITISEEMAEAVVAEHGYDRRRIIVIPNGYEAAAPMSAPVVSDEQGAQDAEKGKDDRLVISHVGTVIARNRPDLFLRSVAALQERGALQQIVFRFVGNLSGDYVRAAGLAAAVETTGAVPRDQAIDEMRGASALLLLTGAYVGRWGYNAKLFEYIRTGRPIVCVEEEAESNDRGLLKQFAGERSFFARAGDAESLAGAVGRLRAWLTQGKTSVAPPDPAFEAYDRRVLVARLAERLDGLTT